MRPWGKSSLLAPAVTQVRVGDIVVPTVRRPCASLACRPCRSGHQDFCVTGQFHERGIKEMHGFMTEYVVERERYLHRVPPEMDALAVLIEPLTIAEKGLEQVWTIQSRLPWGDSDVPTNQRGRGLKALVLGAGPVGILGAMLLLSQGFTTYVYSHGDAPNPRSDIVTALGATYLSPATTPTIAAIPGQIGSLDLVYEAAGSSSLAFGVLQGLAANGIFIFTGVPALAEHKSGDIDRLMRQLVLNNQVGFGTVNAGDRAYQDAITDLALFARRWPAQLRALITHRFSLAEAPAMLQQPSPGIKQVIAIGGDTA